MKTEQCEYISKDNPNHNCESLFDCCDCGGDQEGEACCPYCYSCNACEVCLGEEDEN